MTATDIVVIIQRKIDKLSGLWQRLEKLRRYAEELAIDGYNSKISKDMTSIEEELVDLRYELELSLRMSK
jgi:hypothetical protein